MLAQLDVSGKPADGAALVWAADEHAQRIYWGRQTILVVLVLPRYQSATSVLRRVTRLNRRINMLE